MRATNLGRRCVRGAGPEHTETGLLCPLTNEKLNCLTANTFHLSLSADNKEKAAND